jgi:hypothetical protein
MCPSQPTTYTWNLINRHCIENVAGRLIRSLFSNQYLLSEDCDHRPRFAVSDDCCTGISLVCVKWVLLNAELEDLRWESGRVHNRPVDRIHRPGEQRIVGKGSGVDLPSVANLGSTGEEISPYRLGEMKKC